MIKFVFDNDACQSLIQELQSEYTSAILKESIDRKINELHFTQVGLLEQISGLTKAAFGEGKRRLLGSLELFESNVLPYYRLKVQHQLGLVDDLYVSTHMRLFISNLRDITYASDYSDLSQEYLKRIENWKLLLVNLNERRRTNQEAIRESYRCSQRDFFEEQMSDSSRQEFRENLVRRIIHQLVGEEAVTSDHINIGLSLKSLQYHADYWHSYFRRSIKDGAVSNKGDSMDSTLVLYLDTADYLVTQDRRLRHIVNDKSNNELFGRAIDVTKFIDHINRPFLLNRDPSVGIGNLFRIDR